MTEIIYTRFPKAGITFEGHSCAPRTNGADLCCAGISMLVCTFLKRLEELRLKDKCILYNDGYAKGEFSPRGKEGKQGMELLDTILTGLWLIKERYPDYITIQGGKK